MTEKNIYRGSNTKEALRQGEILTGVIQINPVLDKSSLSIEDTEFTVIQHPYAIIISQDCDLDWDYKARQSHDKPNKLLNSVLFCEMYKAEEIRYDKINHQMNTDKWSLVKTNCNKQYHFFEKILKECDSLAEGLPELIVDFKKIFSIEAEFLYNQINIDKVQRRTVLVSPYLEDVAQRYYSYQGRVALPAPHESEKSI
ncbi:hypothetical protein VB711_11425 [Cronbergia sp. UHCC 0137]|uniref:hypothetical protein n=1 Tax=Cronbergia sp. UHCC 0137 TaxID=3110239 RepID=UPI002B1F0692|nr:hypothetical protein [Cronbergia sp. UHCC 0137]MEA5618444.1 hypothetical protein [Cronbergia sp. UHCC 0137]